MKARLFRTLLAGLALFAASGIAWAGPLQYEITITNITKGEPFSPVVVALHRPQMDPLFKLGEPSSEGIWRIAEDGDGMVLFGDLSADPNVYDVQISDGPFLPGQSVKVVLDGGNGGGGRSLSLAAMLGISNDAFLALNGQHVPYFLPFFQREWTGIYLANAYDAGSEENTESCETVPGPPCGAAGVRDTDGAEGYVYVHSGIQGTGDLDASQLDWNNPVAKITVRVSRHGF
jgi:hypothetical protein